jgi:protein-export membrane protein SecD
MKGKLFENLVSILVILGVLVTAFLFIWAPWENDWPPWEEGNVNIKLGLDLQGGVEAVLQANVPSGSSVDENQDLIDRTLTILNNRVNEFGLAEVLITQLGEDRILVQIPGTQNTEEARSLIGQTALLEFKKVIRAGTSVTDNLVPASPLEEVLEDQNGIPFLVEVDAALTGGALADARVNVNQQTVGDFSGRYSVNLSFTDEGARDWTDMINSMSADDRIAIVLDGVIQSAPGLQQSLIDTARSQIVDSSIITNSAFTQSEANQIAVVLRAGALPVDIDIIQELTVGPTLGADAIERGRNTILIGFALVLIYMLVVYRGWGFIADFALLLNMFIIFGAMSIMDAALTLPGIAGLLLTIGMTVDANVIIFERIKEERRLGKTPHAALRDGFKKSLSTVLDANITTLAAALILFAVGTGPIRGFAITLGLGILGSLFCALFVTRFLLEFTGLGRRAPVKTETNSDVSVAAKA